MESIKVLALGDVVGRPGREACRALLPALRQSEQVDVIIANVENIAAGSGITKPTLQELYDAGVDIMTCGDHSFRKKEGEKLFKEDERLMRPANYPENVPGVGARVLELKSGVRVGVVNLLGRVFLKPLDCPFKIVQREIEKLKKETSIIFVDFHAEATSEKIALGWHLDGKVSAVFGTHTHVQTADEQILPKGTGYITDLGMCGPHQSVIGREVEDAIKLLTTQMPVKLNVATGDARISGAIFEVNVSTGKTTSVKRVHEKLEPANA